MLTCNFFRSLNLNLAAFQQLTLTNSSEKNYFQFLFRRALARAEIRGRFISQLVAKFAKREKIQCQLCSRTIQTMIKCHGYKSLRRRDIENHALTHLSKPLYQCRKCGVYVRSKRHLESHIKSQHNSGKVSEVCIDLSDNYHDDILNIYSQCYNRGDSSGQDPAANKSSDFVENMVMESEKKKIHECPNCTFKTFYAKILRNHQKLRHSNISV